MERCEVCNEELDRYGVCPECRPDRSIFQSVPFAMLLLALFLAALFVAYCLVAWFF